MKKIFSFFKKRPHLLILILILLVGLFLRSYHLVERYNFAHDGDLYSWIVKDILINHHLRLIGQETTAPGIFIGPLFYYLITPFFLIFNMDPIGALVPITIIGFLTILSYYFVFAKLFTKKLGLLAAFIYAVSLELVQLDRLVAPSTLTNIWVVWYFYTIVSLSRGNFNLLPVLGLLIGLIWHIHIALLPTLIAVPIAILVSKKMPSRKQIIHFLGVLFISSLPLIIFELKHSFQQSISLLNNFSLEREGAKGIYKFQLVLEMVNKNLNTLIFAPQSFKIFQNYIFMLVILLSPILLIYKKILRFKDLLPLYSWVLGVIAFFSLSSSPISEYYFANLEIIFILIISSLLYFLSKNPLGKILVITILTMMAFKNIHFMITQSYYNKGYLERKTVVSYITEDAKQKSYHCFAISYITTPGENVGFRYFFYLKNAHLIKPKLDVPVYNIFIPDELSKEEVDVKFGHIGIISPKKTYSENLMQEICQEENTNLTEPMFGYVE